MTNTMVLKEFTKYIEFGNMKNIVICLSILTLVLLGIIFIGASELNDLNRLQQKEIEGLKKFNRIERERLLKQLELTKDSLQIAYQNIAIANKESQQARLRTQATIRNLQKIIFIQHTDSSRTAELKELYPTFKPN